MFVCLFVVSANAASTQAGRWWHVGESVVAAKEGGNLACDEFTLLLVCDVVIATTTHLAPTFFFPAILSCTQSDDDPQENFIQIWLQAKYESN